MADGDPQPEPQCARGPRVSADQAGYDHRARRGERYRPVRRSGRDGPSRDHPARRARFRGQPGRRRPGADQPPPGGGPPGAAQRRSGRSRRHAVYFPRARTSRAGLRARVRSAVRLRAIRSRLLAGALAATAAAALLAACATTVQQEIAAAPPTSIETLSYFPFQVKGYQNSYPRRRMLVLMPVDARDFRDTAGQAHAPADGNPATGVMLGPDGAVVQRIYSSPLGPIVQGAIVRSADEAGMTATASNDS